MLAGKRIILGITGGIAAYKAAFLLREFQKNGAQVRVAMSKAATQFIGIETFAALSKHEVAVDIFPENRGEESSWTRHIDWAEWADLLVIAPCTANSLAKIAGGIADNMLTATVLAARCPVLISPTMDGEMYNSPGVKANLKKLKEFRYHILEPGGGYLASGLEGQGRLPEVDAILQKCSEVLSDKGAPLAGKKVVVTAGPTREYFDPVRFISNPSTGKMGFAMARAAQKLGAQVTLLHGPVSLKIPDNVTAKSFENTKELFELVKEHARADVIIMAAAVSDFTPGKRHDHKIKKGTGSKKFSLQATPDILAWLGKKHKKDQILIGFAMETENLVENASRKREQKNIDWIVANSITEEGSGFSSDRNSVHLLGNKERKEFSGLKDEIAPEVLEYIFRDQ